MANLESSCELFDDSSSDIHSDAELTDGDDQSFKSAVSSEGEVGEVSRSGPNSDAGGFMPVDSSSTFNSPAQTTSGSRNQSNNTLFIPATPDSDSSNSADNHQPLTRSKVSIGSFLVQPLNPSSDSIQYLGSDTGFPDSSVNNEIDSEYSHGPQEQTSDTHQEGIELASIAVAEDTPPAAADDQPLQQDTLPIPSVPDIRIRNSIFNTEMDDFRKSPNLMTSKSKSQHSSPNEVEACRAREVGRLHKVATSTPLFSQKQVYPMEELDVTGISLDVNTSYLNMMNGNRSLNHSGAETEVLYSEEGSRGNETLDLSVSDDSDIQIDSDDDSYNSDHGAAAVNNFQRTAQGKRDIGRRSPDIEELTEKLKNQNIGNKKPLVKYLENVPAPAQQNPFRVREEVTDARLDDYKHDVLKCGSKLVKIIAEMPAPEDDHSDFEVSRRLRVELFPHQVYGVKWMWWREHQYPGGGILADEMGLGKTIMAISLILKSMESEDKETENWYTPANKKLVPSRSTLIVCPVGCIGQWENELNSKARKLRIVKFYGSTRVKSAAILAQSDVVLTTYSTVGSEVSKPVDDPHDQCRSPLLRINWERIMLDEGHVIRNPKTLGAQAICRLNARHRWIVTGTPVHNKPEDFFSLIKFLQLTPFDDQFVWKNWIGMKTVPQRNVSRLHTLGKSMILRRTKEEVSKACDAIGQIPPKQVEDVIVELEDAEAAIYKHLEDFAKQQYKCFLNAKEDKEEEMQNAAYNFDASKRKGKGGKNQASNGGEAPRIFSHFLVLLTRLRQASVLPFLIKVMVEDEEEDDELSYDAIVDPISAKNPVFEPGYKSTKIKAVMKELSRLKSEAAENGTHMDKVIIVSQWTSLLDIIGQRLRKKGFTFGTIDGRDSADSRTETMTQFNKNPKEPQVLLLSITAGGVGLNLVGANHVFFMEPHWNPQIERQAQDRVHRFGQVKPVFIKRFISNNTVEGRVLELQAAKMELSDGLLTGSKKTKSIGLNINDLKKLFDM